MNSTEAKNIRKFGIIALVFFGCLCFLGIWLHKTVPSYVFGCLALLGLGFILLPDRLRPVFAGWLKVSNFIGRVLTIIALTCAYYLVITPSALLKSLFGGRPLPLAPDKAASSYWVTRTESAQAKERFVKRY